MIEAMLPKSGILIVVGQFPRMLRFCPDDVDIGEQACEARFPRKPQCGGSTRRLRADRKGGRHGVCV